MERAARRPHAVTGTFQRAKRKIEEKIEKRKRRKRVEKERGGGGGRRIKEEPQERAHSEGARRMTNRGSPATDRGGLTAKEANRRVNTLLTLRRGGRKPNGIRFGDLVGGLRRPPAATNASACASSLRFVDPSLRSWFLVVP